jgi:hypothetical protein
MGQLHIANFYECDRLSAVAGEVMTPGMIVKVSDTGTGERKLLKLGNSDAAELVAGKYAIVTKELLDALEVTVTTASASSGIRTVSIASGDAVLELRRGVQVEYPADMLHASLDPARAGATPTVGTKLEIVGSLPCAAGTASAITSPIVLRVTKVHGTAVVVELV